MPDRVELFRRIERQHIRDQLSVLGLQSVDGLVLRLLSREGQLRQEDIVLRLVLDKGAVARSVARLEESGLAVRQVSGPVPPGKAGIAVPGRRRNGGKDPGHPG